MSKIYLVVQTVLLTIKLMGGQLSWWAVFIPSYIYLGGFVFSFIIIMLLVNKIAQKNDVDFKQAVSEIKKLLRM